MTKCSFQIFRIHLNSACATFQVRVNLHLRNDVRWIIYYMENPPFNSLVWGSLRLAPISQHGMSYSNIPEVCRVLYVSSNVKILKKCLKNFHVFLGMLTFTFNVVRHFHVLVVHVNDIHTHTLTHTHTHTHSHTHTHTHRATEDVQVIMIKF